MSNISLGRGITRPVIICDVWSFADPITPIVDIDVKNDMTVKEAAKSVNRMIADNPVKVYIPE